MSFDERIFAAIGRLSVAYGELERQSFFALHMVANNGQAPAINDPSRILIAGMTPLQQWKLTTVFLSQPPAGEPEARQEFREWVKMATALRTQRNEVIHASWGIDLGNMEPSALAFDTKGPATRTAGIRWNLFPGQVEDVLAIAGRIEDHHQVLSSWTARQFRRLWPPARESAPHETSRHPEVREVKVVPPNDV